MFHVWLLGSFDPKHLHGIERYDLDQHSGKHGHSLKRNLDLISREQCSLLVIADQSQMP